MFQKLMNNFYYGKSGKGDFTKDDLPTSRKQLFWEMLRIRFAGLFKLNLIYVVVFLPMIYFLTNAALSALSALSDLVVDGAVTADAVANFQNVMQGTIFATCILMIPCILITGPSTAGIMYVCRNWARDEHAFVWSDFKDTAKANWKQALGISAITSVVPVLVYICWTFYGSMSSQSSMLFVLPQVLVLVMGICWMMATIYAYYLMITYKLTFKQLIRNSLLLAVGRLPQSLIIGVLGLLPFLIAFAVIYFFSAVEWVILILIAYYLLLGLALHQFIAASFINGICDKYINPNIEGAKVNMGLNTDPLENYEVEDEEEDGEK